MVQAMKAGRCPRCCARYRASYKGHRCSGTGRPETPACQSAVIQALHWQFGKDYVAIADLTGAETHLVKAKVLGKYGAIPWTLRRFKRQAIEAAKELLRRYDSTD